MTDHITRLKEGLAEVPVQEWFVVGAPWGNGDWITAGHPDPHLGARVADTEDFDGECEHSLEYAAFIAAANPAAIRELLERLEQAEKDARRINWLETQRMAYGFQDIHEGNEWKVDGPFATAREAIDAAIAAQEGSTDG